MKMQLQKKILIPALVVSLLPAIIVGALVNFGFALLTFIVCTAGAYVGYLLGVKMHDYAPVTAIFGKSQSDIAWKKFFAEHGSQMSGFLLGIFIPFVILTTIGNSWGESNSNSRLKNEKSGAISKNTEKIIKADHEIADADVAKYGEFKFKTAVQSAAVDDSTSHGIQVVLRYEPKSDAYAKHLATQLIPSMLQKPVMQPLENGIGFDGSEIEYEGSRTIPWKDDSGKGEEKRWKQKTYSVKKEYDYETNAGPGTFAVHVPIIVFADTIRSLDIEPVLYMHTKTFVKDGLYCPPDYYIGDKAYTFSYSDYDESYKNYERSNEYIKAIRDFVVTGKRVRDSYGGNLADWLDWNKYFFEGYKGDDDIMWYQRSDYDHWYFDHGKQGSMEDYKAFGQKYQATGIPTQYEIEEGRWGKFALGGIKDFVKDYNILKASKVNPETGLITDRNGYATAKCPEDLWEDYLSQFKQFVIAHWGDYPDTFKLHREFEEEAKKNSSYEKTVVITDYKYDAWGRVIGDSQRTEKETVEVDVDTSDEAFFNYVMKKAGLSSEIGNAFAKENGAALQAAYDEQVEKAFRDFYNVYLDERTKIFKSLIDLSKCKVYIDYQCLAAADNIRTLSAITDKRGVIAYKAQVEPGKWVDAECYFTLLDDPNDYLWR